MVTSITRGSVVALVTPMTPNREIDYPKFVDLLKWHVAEGTNGAVVLG
jgi:4-hydroxy-tetrahydrodipicolinate synthase